MAGRADGLDHTFGAAIAESDDIVFSRVAGVRLAGPVTGFATNTLLEAKVLSRSIGGDAYFFGGRVAGKALGLLAVPFA
jgi:hypothetical protein